MDTEVQPNPSVPVTRRPVDKVDLDAKLDELDDHLEPIKENLEEKPEEDTEAEDKPEDIEESAEGEESKEAEDDEGYTIDDGEDDTEDEPIAKGTEAEISRTNLNPEQQYILDNLAPVKVRGEVDGKVQVFDVFDPSQLPDGFKYTSDRERDIATKAFMMVENKATQLQNDYRNQETQRVQREFKAREDKADRMDIAELQKNGDIPRFKADRSSKDFDSDPATVMIQEVLDFKEAQNQKYLDEYNAGRPYKHIGFVEAHQMYKRANPTNRAQDKEDTERKALAQRTAKSRGGQDNSAPRRPLARNSRDLDALLDVATSNW